MKWAVFSSLHEPECTHHFQSEQGVVYVFVTKWCFIEADSAKDPMIKTHSCLVHLVFPELSTPVVQNRCSINTFPHLFIFNVKPCMVGPLPPSPTSRPVPSLPHHTYQAAVPPAGQAVPPHWLGLQKPTWLICSVHSDLFFSGRLPWTAHLHQTAL